jgi:hypothetical protein
VCDCADEEGGRLQRVGVQALEDGPEYSSQIFSMSPILVR